MTNPKISVIVPVYNAEKYLHRCIDSILEQTFTDFELLLINDGSKDNSGKICDEYAAKDSRVRVFHKKNGGVSSARNMGLDNAKGDWVTFVDSDDSINSNYLYSMISQSDADMVMSSFEITDNVANYINYIENEKYYENEIRLFLSKYIKSTQLCTPWCKLYKRNLIGSLKFKNEISLAEDTIFVFAYLCRIRSVRTVKDFSYRYNRGVVDSLSVRYRTINEYCNIIKENYDSLKTLEARFNFAGEEERHSRTLVMFRLCLDIVKKDRVPIKVFMELIKNNAVQEMFKYRNPQFKGPRRRFFDILALTGCYWALYLYVISKKGYIY